MRGLVYADVRHMSQFNTGSDLDLEKMQKSFTVFNARVGLRGPDDRWAVELWAQNLFDKDYHAGRVRCAVAGVGHASAASMPGFYPRSTQLFGAFLAEPRTFGLTLRGQVRAAAARAAGSAAAAAASAAAAGDADLPGRLGDPGDGHLSAAASAAAAAAASAGAGTRLRVATD